MSVKIKELPEFSYDLIDGSEYFPVTDGTDTYKFKLSNINEYVTPEQYGAVGDGDIDDTVSIQSALNSGNKLVIIPPNKTYIFTCSSGGGGLLVPDGVTFKGEGGILKLKSNTCVDSNKAYYPIYNSNGTTVVYDGLVVDGNQTNNNLFSVCDNITAAGPNTIVRNCKIINAVDSGIMFSKVKNGQCVNNRIDNCRDVGIYVNGGKSTDVDEDYASVLVSGNQITKCVYGGIALKRECDDTIVSNNTIDDCGNGITVEDFTTNEAPDNLGTPHQLLITSNYIRRIGTTDFNVTPVPSHIGISITKSNRLNVSNNSIFGCENFGITVRCTSSIISNNMIDCSETINVNSIAMAASADTASNIITGNWLKAHSMNNQLAVTTPTAGNNYISDNFYANNETEGRNGRSRADIDSPVGVVTPLNTGEEFVTLLGRYRLWKAIGKTNTDWKEFNIGNIIEGIIAPSSTPSYIGQEYIDTINKKVYKAVGTSSSADWVALN